MKNKTFKKFSLLFICIMTFFISINEVNAANRPQTNQTFTFDFEFKLRLGDELTKTEDGKNYIAPIIGYKTATYTDQVDLTGEDAIHYKVTEITEEQYNLLKPYQDQLDALDKSTINNDNLIYQNNEQIAKIQEYITKNYWWCYNEYKVGTILLPIDCETKYYVVTVDALDSNYNEMNNIPWNKHTARLYKVEADKNLCNAITEEESKEENPKTGINNPYIICGAIALGSITIILLSKKKKFI